MSSDDFILKAIRAAGMVEPGRLVTDAILVYASVSADEPAMTGYGMVVFNEGSVGHHHLLGLLDIAHSDLLSQIGADE